MSWAGGGKPERTRRDGELERGRRGGDKRGRRNRVVGNGQDTKPDAEDDAMTRREQNGTKDGVEDPTPAARGFTGAEKSYLRRCFVNRARERLV
ncbi:hypothetical protein N665_0611s0031 [Sinapis alba]|nr:hypothetical protein N665_0611s0031 [Sinapis alba]